MSSGYPWSRTPPSTGGLILVLAAMLFILPGILSDLLAIALLMLPINLGRRLATQSAGTGFGDPLDGDYRRIE